MDAPGGRQSIEEFIGTAQKQDDGASGFIVTSAAGAVATNGLCAGERPGRHDEPVEEEDRSAELLLRLQDPALRAYGQDRGGIYSLGDHSGQLDIAALRRSLSGRPKLKRVCHICGRECPSRHKLQRHLSTHSQDRPYNCRICGKAFKWTEYLAKHMRTQHAQGNNSSSANNNSNVLRNYSTAVQSNAASREELGNRANGDLNSPNCQLSGRGGGQQQQQAHQHCSRHSSATNTTFVEAGQNTRPYSLSDEVTTNHQSTQDYYSTSNGVSKANAAVTADFGSSLSQPIHQSPSEDTSSLLFNPTSYAPPTITATVPLSHPNFNQVPAAHNTFSPAATTDPIPSSSKCSDSLCQAIPQRHELEGPLTNRLSATYPTTSGYTQPPPPPLISVPTTADHQSLNYHHSSAIVPCAYHMNSQTDSTSKSSSAQYLNPLPPKTGSSLQQRRAPIKIINLTRKKDIGVQCEVGEETLQALFDQENTMLRRDTMTSCDSITSDILLDDDLSGPVFDPSDSICKFPCEYDGCERSYVHRKDLVRHMKVAHKISPKLLEPQVIESPAKPNVCSVGSCGKSYYHLKDLRRHQRQCHSVNVAAVSPRPEEVWESGGSLRYPCDYSGCTKSYIHKKDLVRHKRMFHSDNSNHPTVPEPVVVVTAKRKESTDGGNSSSVSSPEQLNGRRKRFRLDSSAEPQSSPNLPISNLQPGHSLEADLAALSASNIMDNLAGIVGMGLPASLFNISTTLGNGQNSTSILTADGDVQQLINTLPSAFSCNPTDAATTDDMVGTSNYQNSHLVSFPDPSTTASLLAQYSPMQETFTDDSSTHTTSVVSAGILSHVS